jgi:hypothetical protein
VRVRICAPELVDEPISPLRVMVTNSVVVDVEPLLTRGKPVEKLPKGVPSAVIVTKDVPSLTWSVTVKEMVVVLHGSPPAGTTRKKVAMKAIAQSVSGQRWLSCFVPRLRG